ncbi:RNA polymerase factor sigma-54 [bacterium]|nr:RNA polymerase factor sigma-54 [bacterium]
MGLKQSMKQSLGMAMTPQLQQAIKILQMSVMELQQEINNELVENPTLEEMGEEEDFDPEKKGQEEAQKADTPEGEVEYLDSSMMGTDSYKSTKNTNLDDMPSYEQVLSKPTTLYDHLSWQLRMSTEDERILEIGEDIIGNLNEDGYLVVLVEELAQKLETDNEEIEAVLFRIQRFDPPGVAARNLQECLMIQAEMLDDDDEEEIEKIIQNHLPELETKNYMVISKALDISLEKVMDLSKIIHDMEPKPGRGFSTSEAQYFVPDVYVIKVGKDFMVVLNEEGMPRLKVSKDYKEQLMNGELIGDTKKYVREKLKGAHWLLKSIYQRQRTIYRVTEAILNRQKDFFNDGPQHLKPMVLRDISEELGLHESTVSRVTNGKYMHTPHGIFELKYFFNSAISRSGGEGDLASESVKQKIKGMIDSEDVKKPLSDQQIAEILKDSNIRIARRTVAKYREAMGILPSNKRKKYF